MDLTIDTVARWVEAVNQALEPAFHIGGWIFLVAGSLFAVIGGIGLLRMPDFYCRIHAAGITDTMGAGMVLCGLMLKAGISLVAAKLLIILFFMLVSSPTSTHALAQAAMTAGLMPDSGEPEEERPST